MKVLSSELLSPASYNRSTPSTDGTTYSTLSTSPTPTTSCSGKCKIHYLHCPLKEFNMKTNNSWKSK